MDQRIKWEEDKAALLYHILKSAGLLEYALALIGLLSDSHGRAAVTRRAVALLAEHGADMLLHLGDICSTQVIDAIVVDPDTGPIKEARLVFGNMDFEVESLTKYAASVDVMVDHPAGELAIEGGRSLVYTHGHDARVLKRAIEQKTAYFCQGHTHEARDDRVGHTRVINPGALFRARQSRIGKFDNAFTVAILDIDSDQVTFYPVD